jgi:hypothetical protein
MQSATTHFLAHPFCVFLYTATGKATLAPARRSGSTCCRTFHRRPKLVRPSLRKAHHQALRLAKSEKSDRGGSVAAMLT